MDNYIGRMLDNRYEILEVIGIGGMAVVYKARCHRLNRLVAIKILKDEFSQDAEFRRRFHAESQAVAMLSHPNIVSVYDVSHSGDTDYIVMELIDGITLKQYMEQKGQLNWRETLHFATQIAKALEHAHSRGIVHRDIKPHNIMILKDGSVKVADFGIARITSAQSTLTREALGSVHYISPEQARGSRVDKRSDLYSLGVVMYEMLTGRPPFDGDSPVAVAIQHINGTPVLPTELNPNIPRGLEQITMHAMTAALDQRYESATDMLADLEEFRKNPNVIFDFSAPSLSDKTQVMEPVQAPPPAEQPAPRPQKSRAAQEVRRQAPREEEQPSGKGNRVAVIAGVVCILLAVVGIFVFLYNTFLRDLFTETENTPVPYLVGQIYSEIDPTDYPDVVLVPTWVDGEEPAGTITAQNPESGEVKVGATISLTVSNGSTAEEPVTMPGLVGQTASYAASVLGGMGFQVQQNRVPDDAPADEVIETDPVEGTELQAGQLVTLTVSDGPEEEMVQVPPLELRDVEEALQLIEEAGLEPGSVRPMESDLPEGTVIEQSIAQDVEVAPGTVINLIVSSGPAEEDTPEETDDPSGNDNPDGGSDTEPTDPSTTDDPQTGGETLYPATITVPLPTEWETTVVTWSVDGVPQGEPMEVETAQGTVTLTAQGRGDQLVTVYFDGVQGWSQLVHFSEDS